MGTLRKAWEDKGKPHPPFKFKTKSGSTYLVDQVFMSRTTTLFRTPSGTFNGRLSLIDPIIIKSDPRWWD